MRSRKFLRVALIIAAGFLIFQLGVFAGSRHFRHAWIGEPGAYGTMPFGMPFYIHGGMPHFFMVEGHGAIGTVSAVALPAITVTGRDGSERQIMVASSTQIRVLAPGGDGTQNEQQISPAAIHIGDFIVAIGSPDASGTLTATLIRIMPPPSGATSVPQ